MDPFYTPSEFDPLPLPEMSPLFTVLAGLLLFVLLAALGWLASRVPAPKPVAAPTTTQTCTAPAAFVTSLAVPYRRWM